MRLGATPLPCRGRRRAKRRVSCCAAFPKRPTRPRSRAGASSPATASNSPCAVSRARIERGRTMHFWRGFAIFLAGGVVGTGFGVALGFFFFPFVFPPPPAAEMLIQAAPSPPVATGTVHPSKPHHP